MSHQLSAMALATFAIFIGSSLFSSAWAIPSVNSAEEDLQIFDCTDLTSDLQVLEGYGIISSSDVRDVLMIFQCNSTGII